MRSFKKTCVFAACAAVTVALFVLLDLVLYPCTYARNDVHTLATQQRDVLIMGTSNGKMGVDPDALLEGTGLTGHNACAGGEYPQDAWYLLRLAAEKQDPKILIFDIDAGYFTTQKEKGNNALLFYHEFPMSFAKCSYFFDAVADSDLRSLLFPSYEYPLKTTIQRAGDSFSQKIHHDYDVSHLKGSTQEYHENGYIERYPVSPQDFPAVNPILFSRDQVVEENMRYMEKIVKYCRKKGILFVAVSAPQPDAMIQMFRENYEDGWDYFTQWCREREIPYFNFNTDYYDAYPHDPLQYTDYEGHMNGTSARAYSAVLGKVLGQNGIWASV